jgi:amidase
LATRIRLEDEVLNWFSDTDLWVSPTMAMRTPKIGEWKDDDPEQSFRNVIGMGVYTAVFNVSGQPAISIPMGLDKDGLPIGVQIAGRPGSDALLLRVAHALEQSRGGFQLPCPL